MLPFVDRLLRFPASRLAAVAPGRDLVSLTSPPVLRGTTRSHLIRINCPNTNQEIIKFGLGNIIREMVRPQIKIGSSRENDPDQLRSAVPTRDPENS